MWPRRCSIDGRGYDRESSPARAGRPPWCVDPLPLVPSLVALPCLCPARCPGSTKPGKSPYNQRLSRIQATFFAAGAGKTGPNALAAAGWLQAGIHGPGRIRVIRQKYPRSTPEVPPAVPPEVARGPQVLPQWCRSNVPAFVVRGDANRLATSTSRHVNQQCVQFRESSCPR